MYVCICHGIRCRDVKSAASAGACRAGEVFRHFEVQPRCGRCVATMQDMLQDGRAEAQTQAALTAQSVEG